MLGTRASARSILIARLLDLASAALYSHISPLFQIAVNTPSLSLLEEEVVKYESKVSHDTNPWDLPLICKYLILAAWIASKNPNVDAEVKDRRRRRKGGGKSEASRLEEAAFAPAKSWRLDKLLSILDHILAGNEEEEETAPLDPSTEDKDIVEVMKLVSASMPQTPGSSGSTNSQMLPMQQSVSNKGENISSKRMDVIHEADESRLSGSVSVEDPVEDPPAADQWNFVQFNMDASMNIDLSAAQMQASQGSEQSTFSLDSDISHITFQDDSQDSGMSQRRTATQRSGRQAHAPDLQYEPTGTPFHSSSLFPLLWEANKGNGSQVEILAQVGVLEQTGFFVRLSAATSHVTRSRSEYRCGYDSAFVNKIADSMNFPLWGFL